MKELSLYLIQQARVIVEFEVNDLSTFDINDKLTCVRASHQDATFVRLPLSAAAVLTSSSDLDDAATRYLNEDIAMEQYCMQGLLIGLETWIRHLRHFVLSNL